jgi:hypothetical protein
MRGDIIFQVFGVHAGRDKDVYFGAFQTTEKAQAEIERLHSKVMHGSNWAQQYHNKGFVIRPTVVTTDFEIPSLPKPRDKYLAIASAEPRQPGIRHSTHVEVFRRGLCVGDNQRICAYERNYAMLQTFEPFRQRGRELALISRHYTTAAVLDLVSGTVIAEEVHNGAPGYGFCPVGFYVPDWWDVNDGSTLPGSEHWSGDDEWPLGDFGFVWGCQWGDDSSWKVQYLDLSRVQDGVIGRDERFGYLELATAGFRTPCLVPDLDLAKKTSPPGFIRVSRYKGISKVGFAVEMAFDLQTGKSEEWQRLKIANLE